MPRRPSSAVGFAFRCLLATLAAVAPLPLAAQEIGVFVFGPAESLYPDYLADPRRPQFSGAQMIAFDSELAEDFDSGDGRFALALGERLRLVRWPSRQDPELGWQLDVDGAIFAQFDQSKSLDNIGWDGVYGLRLGWRFAPQWSLAVAFRHLSAHIGDEFELETGRGRIDYTREDLALGLAWMPDERFTVYTEWGYVPVPDDPIEEWVGQAGAHYTALDAALFGHLGWYVALDVKAYQESDWEPDVAIRAALVAPTRNSGRGFEIGVEAYHGRAILGEFSILEENYVSVFLTYDL